MSTFFHYKLWDEITDPFPNVNDAAVQTGELKNDLIPI